MHSLYKQMIALTRSFFGIAIIVVLTWLLVRNNARMYINFETWMKIAYIIVVPLLVVITKSPVKSLNWELMRGFQINYRVLPIGLGLFAISALTLFLLMFETRGYLEGVIYAINNNYIVAPVQNTMLFAARSESGIHLHEYYGTLVVLVYVSIVINGASLLFAAW